MPKDAESLEQSRAIRQHLLAQWGRVPSSIWKVDWSLKYIELSKSYGEQQKINEAKVGKEFALSGTGARHGQLSRFPQDILHFLVKFLTPEKLDNPGYFKNYLPTVIDPFAGHNSRGEGCWRNNRNYVGWDISASYDTEYYGDEPEQLGRQYTYNDFIYSLGKIYENVYRALKPNSFCVVETNDFRRNGEFHTYHADMIGILKRAGFVMHDMIICDYGSGFLEAFLSDIEANKIVSKNHSYFAIAKKLYKKIENRIKTRERLVSEVKTKENIPVFVQQKSMF